MTVYKRIGSFIISFILVFSMICPSFVFQTSAAASPALTVQSNTVSAGEKVVVAVYLANATSVYGGNFTLQYDSSKLKADSFTFGSIVGGHTKNCNLNYQSAGNLIRVTFSGASAVTSSGTLISLTFTAKENVSGAAALQFTAYKMYDENGSAITSTATGSTITISSGPVVTPAISVTSKTVTVGDTVSVPVVITNSSEVYGGNFTLQYDSTLLTADSYSFGSIVSGHTKNCNLNYQSAGNLIRVTFSGAEAVSGDGTLVTFTFTAKAEGTATLKFNAYKTYNENGSSINTVVSNGTVKVDPKPSRKMVSVDISNNPTKTTYYIGDSLSTSGLKLLVTYSDGTTETITSGFTTSGFSSSTAGTKTVTVSYEGFADTFTVTVKTPSITLSSSSKTLTVGDSSTITAATTPSGQSVTWTSSNTSVATVSGGTITAKAAGSATITAKFTYNGIAYSATCSVTVKEPVATKLEVTSNPTKTVYEIGESLNTSGLKLKVTYSNGSTETITTGFTTSGFSSATAGTKTVTVKYGNLTTSFTVTVKELVATKLEVTSNPTKTVYEIGESLNTSGLKLKVTYSNGSTETITTGFTTSGFSSATAGTKTVTVKYGNLTTSFTVTVKELVATKLEVTSNPTKTVYEIGESLNTSGLKLKVTYSNGFTETITTGFTTSGFSSSTAGTKTVTVKYGNLTTTFTVTVKDPVVDENTPQIFVESKKVPKGREFTVTVEIKNNPGFSYLEVTPKYDSALTLVKVENGELISDFTKGKQYVWVSDEDVTEDGLLLTFTFSTAEDLEAGNYQVNFQVRTCANYDEQAVKLAVVPGNIEVIDFVYGDATGDGNVDGFDVIRLKKYLANYDYDTQTSATEIALGADANGDGKVDGFDVIRLKKYLANYDYDTGESSVVLGPQ